MLKFILYASSKTLYLQFTEQNIAVSELLDKPPLFIASNGFEITMHTHPAITENSLALRGSDSGFHDTKLSLTFDKLHTLREYVTKLNLALNEFKNNNYFTEITKVPPAAIVKPDFTREIEYVM